MMMVKTLLNITHGSSEKNHECAVEGFCLRSKVWLSEMFSAAEVLNVGAGAR